MEEITFSIIRRYADLDESYTEQDLVSAYNDSTDLYEFDDDMCHICRSFYQGLNEAIFNGLDKFWK